ncbi:MAG: alanyl-tRNA editing protein [Candidatus Diapherotrites archaeon]
MTELLYLSDCYLKEFEATVLKAEGNFIELDSTAFYPESGGQPSDKGKLFCNEQEYVVLKCKKQAGTVLHEIDRQGLKAGDKVKGIIDWNWRYKLMRMHTGAHILTMAIQYFFPTALVTGGQIGFEESRDDYSLEELSPEIVKKIEEKANEIVNAGIEVQIKQLPREEAFKLPQLFKLRDVLPPNIPIIRIIQIAGDMNACGGTHVKNTKEVGKIKITETKSKGAGNKRIYYKLEP